MEPEHLKASAEAPQGPVAPSGREESEAVPGSIQAGAGGEGPGRGRSPVLQVLIWTLESFKHAQVKC